MVNNGHVTRNGRAYCFISY